MNLQNTVANTKEFRGLGAKMHHLHFGKGSNAKTNITTLILGKNYPKVLYGIAIFEFGIALGNFKRNEGPICKITTIQKLEGAKFKIDITIVISG